jgi:NADH dehydrogenase
MPELGENLGTAAMEMLAKRGIDVRLETSVTDITRTTVTLSSGETVPCRTLVWTAGVTASPLIGTLGAETVRGRLVVGADLTMPTHRDVFSLGDCAAVPDLAKGDGSVCPPTAQYAQRQAKVAAHNVVASLRNKPLTEFRHKDLGLVVDLGGTQAVARPLGRDLRGLPAQVITRGYHLMAMPSVRGRTRVLSNWGIHAVGGDDFVRLGFLDSVTGSLKDFESKDGYLNAEQIAEQVGEPAQKGTAA